MQVASLVPFPLGAAIAAAPVAELPQRSRVLAFAIGIRTGASDNVGFLNMFTITPEPSGIVLLGSAVLGVAGVLRRGLST